MKRLLLVLIVLFGVRASFATSIDAVALSTFFTPTGGFMQFFLNGNESQGVYLLVKGVDVLSLTCGNATCTRFNSDIVLSQFISLIGVHFEGNTYTDVSFLGSLEFTSTRLSVAVDGTLIACTNPSCSSGELFTVDVHTHGVPIIVATNTNGTLSLVSARDVVPEPGTVGLLGTGLLGIAGAVRKKITTRL